MAQAAFEEWLLAVNAPETSAETASEVSNWSCLVVLYCCAELSFCTDLSYSILPHTCILLRGLLLRLLLRLRLRLLLRLRLRLLLRWVPPLSLQQSACLPYYFTY